MNPPESESSREDVAPPSGALAGERWSGTLEQFATRAAFLVCGTVVSVWAPLVPVIRDRMRLDNGQLGMLLLCMGLGSVLTMPFSGGFIGRLGCRTMICAAGGLCCLALPVMATAPTPLTLAMTLFAFGMGLGTLDVSMNTQAVIVEKASGRPMMSGFHGLFSLGCIVGAGILTGLMSVGVAPVAAVVILDGATLLLLFGFFKGYLPWGGEENTTVFALPRGRVILLGALCFVLFMAEGSVADWSGVLLNTVRGVLQRQSGVGYVAFATTMTLGRLTGDAIVRRLGTTRVVAFGAACAALGFAMAALAPAWQASVVGFALVGVGAANVVPVMFTAAGAQKSMPPHDAVAAVTTMGYAGILVGPAAIGFIARASSLPIALGMIACVMVGVSLTAREATVSTH